MCLSARPRMYVHGDVKGEKSDRARDAQKAKLVRREPRLASKTDPSAVRKDFCICLRRRCLRQNIMGYIGASSGEH